jgi:4-aminobutyrate aminotransferase
VETLEKSLFRHVVSPEEVAAIFVEPIQGEGGYIVPPAEFLPGLKQICERHGILLVVDEVQSGFGRTGKMFACEHWNIEPDILCLAKGIASGLPLGAMIARTDLSTWTRGAHGSTFGGNPVACAASLATLELLDNALVQNAAIVGSHLKARLEHQRAKHAVIHEVRGLGLMLGVELVKPDGSGTPDTDLRNEVILRAFEKGLLLLGCGLSTLRFSPPLIVDQTQSDVAVGILDETLTELTRS